MQGLGPEHRGGAAEPESLGPVVEAAVVGGSEAVFTGDTVALEIRAGVIDEVTRRPDRHRLTVDPEFTVMTGIGQRDIEGSSSRGPAPSRRHMVDDGVLGVVDPRPADVLQHLDGVEGDRMELTAQRTGVAGGVPGLVIEDHLSESAVQDDLGRHRGHGGIGQHVSGGVDPRRAGHGVVVEQPDDLAPGMAQAQVDASREPEVDRGADHLGMHRPGHDRDLFVVGSVVDDDDLVGLCHR